MTHELVFELIDDLKDVHWLRRSRAAEALGRLGHEAERAVPALRTALDDGHREVRRDAVDALGKIGPSAAGAVPNLIALLADTDIGFAAHNALAAIGLPAVPALVRALADSEMGGHAEWVLYSIGEPVVDQLLGSVDINNERVLSRIVSLISALAPAGNSEAFDALLGLAMDKRLASGDRFMAARTLEKLDAKKAADLDLHSIYDGLFPKR